MPSKRLDFKLPHLENVKTKGQARDLAISWRHWMADQNLSYGEVIYYSNYFEQLADKFNLKEEFKENIII